jgi:hypothetical protein
MKEKVLSCTGGPDVAGKIHLENLTFVPFFRWFRPVLQDMAGLPMENGQTLSGEIAKRRVRLFSDTEKLMGITSHRRAG